MKINKIFIFFLIYASCLFKKSTAPIQLEFFLDSMTPDEFGISMMCILKITDPHYILVDYYITNDGNTSIAVPNNSLTMPSVYFDSKNNTRYIQNISSEFWNPPEIITDELLIIIHPIFNYGIKIKKL